MDLNGFSDPYCRFLMGGALLCKSDTKKKNLNPEWNQNFAVKIPANTSSNLVLEGISNGEERRTKMACRLRIGQSEEFSQ